VKMLQRRNGRRRELAYTIDHLRYCCEKNGEAAREWLSHFEVLVIDECSNVSMGRIAKLLPLFSRLRKIVFVGDTDQLKSLNAGDALCDLTRWFPSFRLTENLRVAPELKTLQEVPGHILAGRLACVQWAPKAWEAPVSNPSTVAGLKDLIKALYAKLLVLDSVSANNLLDTQFLVLCHDGNYGRMAVNSAVQAALEELGILKRVQLFTLYKDFSIYQGCKITFKKNYNHRIEKDFGAFTLYSDPVANGELAIVRSIEHVKKPGYGILMKISDSSDGAEDSLKTVWIEERDGVNPFHIQLGNAITVYTSQGREFPNVVFCVDPKLGSHWTKANAYVASSRAQKRFLLLGERAEFNAMAARPNAERRTIFSHLLGQSATLTAKTEPSTQPEVIIRDPETLSVAPANMLVVPVFREQ
jgi:exodeoxyribonuclease V alpha subunit